MAMRGARAYIGDRLIRTAKPHRMLDPGEGPLIAVRLNILTRKTLGGLQTDLDSRVLDADGQPLAGLYAAGEAPGSAAAACMAMRRWRERFSAAAFSPAAVPAGRRALRWGDHGDRDRRPKPALLGLLFRHARRPAAGAHDQDAAEVGGRARQRDKLKMGSMAKFTMAVNASRDPKLLGLLKTLRTRQTDKETSRQLAQTIEVAETEEEISTLRKTTLNQLR